MCIKKIDDEDDEEEGVADMFHCQPGVMNTEEGVDWWHVIAVAAQTAKPLQEFIGSGQILDVNGRKHFAVHRQRKCTTCGPGNAA